MPPALRPWFRLLRAGFQAQARYLPAAAGGFIANTTFGFLKGAVLTAVVTSAGGAVAGYDLKTMAAYVWLSQGLIGVVNLTPRSDIADRIKSGDVAVDLLRPMNLLAATVASDLGRGLFQIPIRLLPALLVGSWTTAMALPSAATPYLLGAVAVLLAMVISALARFALAACGFWVVETRGLQILYLVGSTFLAGLYTPLALFPDWLRTVALATPFPAILQTPIDVISGRIVGREALQAVAVQCGWLLALIALGSLLLHRGRLRVEVQGG